MGIQHGFAKCRQFEHRISAAPHSGHKAIGTDQYPVHILALKPEVQGIFQILQKTPDGCAGSGEPASFSMLRERTAM